MSSLICPWPNCKNGISEDKFILDRSDVLPGSKKSTEVHSRKVWTSLDGELYYSWESEDLPNWFGVENTIWAEARRKKLIKITEQETIYHYTSLEGAIGIIESGCLWLSDYSYLNDSSELLHGVQLITEIIEEIQLSGKYKEADEVLESWKSGLKNIDKRICIASFSKDGDSLCQWRSYGDLALGFDAAYPIGIVPETALQPIIYDTNEQR